MRRHLRWTLALAAAFVVAIAGMAIAKPTVITVGNLVLKFDGSVSPKALPKNELAPISFKVSAHLTTKDGNHPPAAQAFKGEFDKNAALNTKGLPTCKQGQLEARTTADAKKACASSIIGEGFAQAEVQFPESNPFDAKGPLIMFNGGTKGNKTLILIHVYANVPAPTAFITRVDVTKINKGPYGLGISSKIPVVAGGSGSLTDFEITGKKFFTYKGKKQSYFLAKCPNGNFRGQGEVSFSDGTKMRGTVATPCTPKG